LAVDVDGPPRPQRDDPQLRAQRDVLKAALQLPAFAGPVYDSLPEEAFTDPAYLAVHRAVLAAGGTSSGLAGPALIAAVTAHCAHSTVRTLVSELAVEPLPTKNSEDGRYVVAVLAGLRAQLLSRQIADIKSRLHRLSPIEHAEEFRDLWGDLVALEQYHKALREQAAGALG
jgi:DNA primase